MNSFTYARPTDVAEAIADQQQATAAKFIAGGTNILDLMKENVERPERLIDINHLPLAEITETEDGGLRLGPLVTNANTAYDERVMARYPLLSQTILAGASPQLRNMATLGGNDYAASGYHPAFPCSATGVMRPPATLPTAGETAR